MSINKQIKDQTDQCEQPSKYGPRSRNSDSTNFLKTIRTLQNKKSINQNDFKDLSNLIEKQHISALGNLSNFFIKLRNQLILGDHNFEQMGKCHPDYKDKSMSRVESPFSKYFHSSLGANRFIFSQLYEILRKKIQFYKKNSISQFFVDENDPYTSLAKKLKIPLVDEKTIQFAFPQAYQFYKSLQQFVKAYYVSHVSNPQANKDQYKEKIIYSMAKQQYISQTSSNYSFIKPSDLVDKCIQFDDHQFYQIQSFIDKVKLQASLLSKSGSFSNQPKKQFKSIPIKCIGCASILYQGQPIPRDRSSMNNFEVIKSVKDSKTQSRLRQLIEGFMNSPNGGVILFDCDDHLFEVYPKGFETNLKNFQSRRQSIIDICKNYFKDFQVDRDFTIDFIILHDENGNPIINSAQTQQGLMETQFFITRLKIFGRKITSELKTNDEVQNKFQKNKNIKIIAHEITNNDIRSIDYQEMKTRFYKNQNIIKQIDKPEVYKKIQAAFYHNKQKIHEILKGRTTPFYLHETYTCKNSQMVTINTASKNSSH